MPFDIFGLTLKIFLHSKAVSNDLANQKLCQILNLELD